MASVIIPSPIPFPERECITGDFLTDGFFEGSYLRFGKTQLCADVKDGKIIFEQGSLMVSPDYDVMIDSLQDEISRWKDCSDSILLCPPDFKRSEPK